MAEQELDVIQLTSASRHMLDRESVANVQGLDLYQLCVLNARLAGFPQRSWSRSRTRWCSPWIWSGLPNERSTDLVMPLGSMFAVAEKWPFWLNGVIVKVPGSPPAPGSKRIRGKVAPAFSLSILAPLGTFLAPGHSMGAPSKNFLWKSRLYFAKELDVVKKDAGWARRSAGAAPSQGVVPLLNVR